MKKIFFTTSWDDGYPLDIKLAKLLLKYNIKGTFYIAFKNKERKVLKKKDINHLCKVGFEIGSHSVSHPILTKINKTEQWYEIYSSKKILEKIIKKEVNSFCYPKGIFNSHILELVKKAGYKIARTTRLFIFDNQILPFLMPVSIHFSQRSKISYVKQGLKEKNYQGLFFWFRELQLKNDPLQICIEFYNYLKKCEGVFFHLWGHSWELEQQKLWKKLESFLRFISSKKEVCFLTNYQLIKAILN